MTRRRRRRRRLPRSFSVVKQRYVIGGNILRDRKADGGDISCLGGGSSSICTVERKGGYFFAICTEECVCGYARRKPVTFRRSYELFCTTRAPRWRTKSYGRRRTRTTQNIGRSRPLHPHVRTCVYLYVCVAMRRCKFDYTCTHIQEGACGSERVRFSP